MIRGFRLFSVPCYFWWGEGLEVHSFVESSQGALFGMEPFLGGDVFSFLSVEGLVFRVDCMTPHSE